MHPSYGLAQTRTTLPPPSQSLVPWHTYHPRILITSTVFTGTTRIPNTARLKATDPPFPPFPRSPLIHPHLASP
jgi:hypothetical protein